MAYLFQTIFNRAAKRFERARNTYDMPNQREVQDWYRSIVRQVGKEASVDPEQAINPENKLGQARSSIDAQSIGKLYHFFYDPKWKEELPYYDTFPLVFPIELYSDGFLGINLHYLPPYFRAKLMDALYTTAEKSGSLIEKLSISYKILANASRFKYFKPCIKRYLTSHMRSMPLEINVKYWDMALMMPTARFKKMSMEDVHIESLKKV